MDRPGLADFLSRRRAVLQPADVGLPPGLRRRTPGLRRDEVAALAAMSTDYYTRLEQGRGPHPSATVLESLSRALRLSDDEHDHLFFLAGRVPPPRQATTGRVSAGVLQILDRIGDLPAFVIDDLGRTVVQNAMSATVSGDALAFSGQQRSYIWRWFTVPAQRDRFPVEDWPIHSRSHVADLRATHGRRRGDADVETLVADLLAASREFAQLWETHEVAVRRSEQKRILHPEVGLLDFLCETMTGVSGESLVVLYPRPGTDTRAKLDLLRVIGTQDLAPVER